MRSFYDLMGVPPSGFDPDHRFQTSWLLPPTALATLRLTFSLFCLATILTSWIWYGTQHNSPQIYRDFSYFTNLTYWGLLFYMAVAAAHGFVYVRHGRTWLDRWPRWLQMLHGLFYTTVITMPVLVTVVYWVVLFNGVWFTKRIDAFLNISKHALNSLLTLSEILLPSTNPPPLLHILLLWLILALYLGVAYLTRYTQGWYVYAFLNPDGGKHSTRVVAYTFGITAAMLVIFLVVWVLVWVRKRVTGLPKLSKRDVGVRYRYDGYSYANWNDVEMSVK